jgi:hypothetical protein
VLAQGGGSGTGGFSTGTLSCIGQIAPCPTDNSQDNSVTHTATALGLGIQTSAATGGAGSINISAPTQTVTAQAATDSFNGGDSHAVAVGGHRFAASGNGGSFVALPVGGASNTGGSAPTG